MPIPESTQPPAQPKISVITPCLNAAQTLPKTIESIQTQHYPNLEYIVIDAESTDGTVDVIKKYASRISHWVSEKDSGTSEGINKGIARATGDFIGILPADDYYLDGALRNVAEYIRQNPEVDVVNGNISYVGTARPQYRIRSKPNLQKDDFAQTFGLFHLMGCFVRRECFVRHGAFDTAYRIANDYELFLRFSVAGVRFGHLDKTIAVMHAGGMSSKVTQPMVKEFRQAFYQHKPTARARLTFERVWLIVRLKGALINSPFGQPIVRTYRQIRNRVVRTPRI